MSSHDATSDATTDSATTDRVDPSTANLPVANLRSTHIGIQVADLSAACEVLTRTLGLTFAEPITGWPVQVRIGTEEELEESSATFTVSRQGPPFFEVQQNWPGSKIWHSDGKDINFHHLGFWVDDVEAASAELEAAGYPFEAGGLNEAGRLRYAYHLIDGLRVEVCDRRAQAAFERWGTSGKADGISNELNSPSPAEDPA